MLKVLGIPLIKHKLTGMSHIPRVKRYLPYWVSCDATITNSIGFFILMYKTKTRIENDLVLIEIHFNGAYWHDYYFELSKIDYFMDHISSKVWGTRQNLGEIYLSVWKSQVNM